MKFSKVLFTCSGCNGEITVVEQEGGHRKVNAYCSSCGREYFVNFYLTNDLLKIEVNADVEFYHSPRTLPALGSQPLSNALKPY